MSTGMLTVARVLRPDESKQASLQTHLALTTSLGNLNEYQNQVRLILFMKRTESSDMCYINRVKFTTTNNFVQKLNRFYRNILTELGLCQCSTQRATYSEDVEELQLSSFLPTSHLGEPDISASNCCKKEEIEIRCSTRCNFAN